MKELALLAAKTGASSVALMMVDESKKLLKCVDSYNLPKSWKTITNPLDASTLNGKVWSTGEYVIANDLDIIIAGHPVAAALIIPINQGGKVIGTLELVSNQSHKLFTNEDLEAAMYCLQAIIADSKLSV